MIDNNDNPVFIDIDNYDYLGYGYTKNTTRQKLLGRIYSNKSFSKEDSDKFVFGMMAIDYFIKCVGLEMSLTDKVFTKIVDLLNADKELKDGLRLILSNANNKQYIGSIIENFDLNQPLLSE